MTSRLRRPAGALIVGALAAGVLGVAPLAHAAAPGTITGTVTSSEGTLRNVFVQAYALDGDGDWNYVEDSYTHTEPNGTYTLDLPEGQYRVGFSHEVFVDEYYDDAAEVEDGQTLIVSGGTVTADAELAFGGHVTGTVTGPGNAPLGEIGVTAYQEVVDADGDSSYESVGGASTDGDGSYDIGGLAAGTYRIGFHPYAADSDLAPEFYDDQPAVESAKDLVVGGSTIDDIEVVSGINAQLDPASQISGRVTDASDAPLGDAFVSAYVLAGTEWVYADMARTTAEGSYTLDGLPKGTYRVGFDTKVAEDYLYEYWNNKGSLEVADDIAVGTDVNVQGKDATLVVGEHDPKYVDLVAEPTISGNLQVGSTLTANPGTWNPSNVTATYQWFRAGKEGEGAELVAGATGATYALTAADQGKYVWVEVIVSYPGYGDGYAWATVGPIAAAPAPVPVPVPVPDEPTIKFPKGMDVKGDLTVGSVLKLKNYKAIVSRAATSYKFQWFAGKKKIKKATKSTLKLTKALKGKKISIKVTAKVGTTTKSVKIKVGKVR